MSWVNAQLRKRPGLKPIKDLRRDLQDGVVLVQLIEIVGKSIHVVSQDFSIDQTFLLCWGFINIICNTLFFLIAKYPDLLVYIHYK